MLKKQIELFISKSVPLVLVNGAIDEVQTVTDVLVAMSEPESENGRVIDCFYRWDCIRGLVVEECREKSQAAEWLDQTNDKELSTDSITALGALEKILGWSREQGRGYSVGCVFFMGDVLLSPNSGDRHSITQYLMLLRDKLVEMKSIIVLVGLDFDYPPALKEHIVVTEADLPTDSEYESFIQSVAVTYENACKRQKIDPVMQLDEARVSYFKDILKGQSAFSARQNLALSLTKEGIEESVLRQRAISTINSTKGLAIQTGDGGGFASLGGLDALKEFSSLLIGSGRVDFKLVVYVDEIEKHIGGEGGKTNDTSGVSGNLLGSLLTDMQDSNSLGMLLTGVPGAGKSAFAKAFGEEVGGLTVHLDISAMKDSLVGNSESNMRRALQVIRSIGGSEGGIIYIATCNRISQLPPELRRRFNLGTFFFGFPTQPERAAIWDIYLQQFGLLNIEEVGDPMGVIDTDWTGAEIESCCRLAYFMGISIEEAAKRIVPVKDAAKNEIDRLCLEAEGKFLDASYPGTFKRKRTPAKAQGKQTNREREISL